MFPKPICILAQPIHAIITLQTWLHTSTATILWRRLDLSKTMTISFDCDTIECPEIFEKNTLPEDPTVYINVSAKKSISDAPNGSENWFVMINVPANNGQDWDLLRQKARRIIIEKISRLLGVQIEPLIVVEDYLDPIRIETRTSSAGGALYGTSSNDRMAAFFRHPNFSTVKGLFFIGGSVHPGGGIPLCLYSAKIATDLVAQVKNEGH